MKSRFPVLLSSSWPNITFGLLRYSLLLGQRLSGHPVPACFSCFACPLTVPSLVSQVPWGQVAQQEDPGKAQRSSKGSDLILPPGSFFAIMHRF